MALKTIIKYVIRWLLFLILRKKQIKKKKQFSFQNNFVMRPSKICHTPSFRTLIHEVDKTFFFLQFLKCFLVYTPSCTNFILLLLKHISSIFFVLTKFLIWIKYLVLFICPVLSVEFLFCVLLNIISCKPVAILIEWANRWVSSVYIFKNYGIPLLKLRLFSPIKRN